MMTRSLYENPDLERYRRHQYSMQQWDQRNTALELSHAERLQIRSAPTGRPERIPSESEQDSRDGTSQTRRQRIAVACARCRKRKIKCSGDPGNGMGCQNCRNAGSETCNFFRVGSHDLGAALNGPPQHPPNTVLNSCPSQPGMDRLSYVTVPTAYTCPTRGYLQAHIPLNISTRNLAGSDYSLHYDTESPTENYGLQTTPLSAQDPYSGYTGSDLPIFNGRSWTTNVNTQRLPATYSHYTDQEASAGYSTTQLPCPGPTANRQPLSTTDSISSFNVVSLHNSLPNAATDRVLPNPMANANARQPNYVTPNLNTLNHRTNVLGNSGLPTHPHSGLPSVYTTKTHPAAWVPENAHEARSNSIPSLSSVTDLIAPPPSKVSTTTSSSASDSSPHSYILNGTSPDVSPTNPVSTYSSDSSAYSSISSTRSTIDTRSSQNLQNSASNQSLHGASSHPGISIASQPSQANLYSFTRDPDPRVDREGTLVNGEDYRPLPQPHQMRQQNFARHDVCVEPRQPGLLRQTSMHSIHSPS